MSEYTTTPNLGLYLPVPGEDDDAWGDHLNFNTTTLDSALADGPWLPLTGGGHLTGALTLDGALSVTTGPGIPALMVSTSKTDTAADYAFNTFSSIVNYTANATGGDNLALISYMVMRPNGHQVMLSGHTCAIYANAYLDNDGNAASRCAQLNGGMFVSGNGGPGTLDRGVDVFGHANFKTGGGTITDHYFLYQEASSAATHEYGAYFSAPIGIGTTAPTYALHINCAGGANVPFSNGIAVDMSADGSFYVTRTGTYLYPGYNPGAGGFGCVDLIVGYNGTAEPTNSTRGFLYITSCPGTPIGAPPQAAIGRCAMRYDTTANKLWIHNGTSWRGVVLT